MDETFEFKSCVNPNEKIKTTVERISVDDEQYNIKIVKNVFSESEIDYLLKKELDDDGWMASRVGDLHTSSHTKVDNHRISRSAWLQEEHEDEIIACLKDRFVSLNNKQYLDKFHIEPLQLVKYDHVGSKYDEHFDSQDDEILNQICKNKNHELFYSYCSPSGEPVRRDSTMFVVMETTNLDKCGGETVFPNIIDSKSQMSLKIEPKRNQAVLFDNLNEDKTRHFLSLHAGAPITCKNSKKVGMNIWFSDTHSKHQLDLKNSE